MKTTLFEYQTDIGTFWIRPEPAGRVQLGLDRKQAANVPVADYAGGSGAGHAAWDENPDLPAPASLDRWKRPAAKKSA